MADEKASAEITLNHLLHHTSGLSEAGYGIVLPPETTLEEAVRSLSQAELTAPVGMEFQYFNLGYDVLAYIIEVVTGQSYAENLQEKVLVPLGMTHTTADQNELEDVSQGYSRLFGFAIPRKQIVRKYGIGAGYIVSTAEDMAFYAIAMMNDGAGLINPETARQIFTPGLGDYGMGWHITPRWRKNLSWWSK